MIHKIIKNRSKSIQNQWKSRLGLVLGARGGGLGSHLGSQGRLAQKKGARYPKNDRVWAPILESIFDIVRFFSELFCILFLVSILMATRTGFSWILISLLDHF